MTESAPQALRFSRFEFKYVLDRELRDRVESALRHFVALDPHVAGQPQASYFVRSLYFDDPAFSAFHDKVDGVLQRSKFRVRTYGRSVDAGATWFLEVKGRHDNLVWKHRTPLVGDFDRGAAGDALVRELLRTAAPGHVREGFEFALFRRRIRPCVVVDYLRRPYVSRFDPDFRLTFDEGISAMATDAMYPEPSPAPRSLLRGFTVMEVKFRRHVPAWFHRILQTHELRRQSVSKVCTAMQSLRLQCEPN